MASARPVYALLLGPTLVLAEYGMTHVSPFHLVRPLLVATIAGLVIFLAARAITRQRHIAGVVTAASLLAIAGSATLLSIFLLALPVAAWWSYRRRQVLAGASTLTPVLNAIVGVWLLIGSATALWMSLPRGLPAAPPATVASGESVYLLMLDAYPRYDTLMAYFGFDNSTFLNALEDRGFEVASSSTTAYPGTSQVVPTMLRMQSLEELLDGAEWVQSDEQYRLLWYAINFASVPEAYSAAGYETHAILTTAESLDWRTADVVRETPWFTRFEDHLLGRGILAGLIPFSAMDRAELLDGFRHLHEAIGPSRRFVFAHMMTPHNPYVFDAEGNPAEPCGTECVNHIGPPNPTLGDRLTGQLRWTNSRVIEAVDRIIKVDSAAVVIVFGDHGIRRDPTDLDEWHRPLFAARGADFPDDVVISELFEILLDSGPSSDPR